MRIPSGTALKTKITPCRREKSIFDIKNISMKGIFTMKNVIIFAEYTEVAPKLEVKHVDASQFDESIFAQQDWEIDSIMREIGAR